MKIKIIILDHSFISVVQRRNFSYSFRSASTIFGWFISALEIFTFVNLESLKERMANNSSAPLG